MASNGFMHQGSSLVGCEAAQQQHFDPNYQHGLSASSYNNNMNTTNNKRWDAGQYTNSSTNLNGSQQKGAYTHSSTVMSQQEAFSRGGPIVVRVVDERGDGNGSDDSRCSSANGRRRHNPYAPSRTSSHSSRSHSEHHTPTTRGMPRSSPGVGGGSGTFVVAPHTTHTRIHVSNTNSAMNRPSGTPIHSIAVGALKRDSVAGGNGNDEFAFNLSAASPLVDFDIGVHNVMHAGTNSSSTAHSQHEQLMGNSSDSGTFDKASGLEYHPLPLPPSLLSVSNGLSHGHSHPQRSHQQVANNANSGYVNTIHLMGGGQNKINSGNGSSFTNSQDVANFNSNLSQDMPIAGDQRQGVHNAMRQSAANHRAQTANNAYVNVPSLSPHTNFDHVMAIPSNSASASGTPVPMPVQAIQHNGSVHSFGHPHHGGASHSNVSTIPTSPSSERGEQTMGRDHRGGASRGRGGGGSGGPMVSNPSAPTESTVPIAVTPLQLLDTLKEAYEAQLGKPLNVDAFASKVRSREGEEAHTVDVAQQGDEQDTNDAEGGESLPSVDVYCPSGWQFSLFDSDIRQHYYVDSTSVIITAGAIKYVDYFNRFGHQTRFRFQLCRRYRAGRCKAGNECQYLHSKELPRATNVHVNENAATSNPATAITAQMVNGGINTLQYPTLPQGIVFNVFPPNNASSTSQLIGSHQILKTSGAMSVFQVLSQQQGSVGQPMATCQRVATFPHGPQQIVVTTPRTPPPTPNGLKPRHCAHFQFKRMCHLGYDCNFIHSLVPFIQGVSYSFGGGGSGGGGYPSAGHRHHQQQQQTVLPHSNGGHRHHSDNNALFHSSNSPPAGSSSNGHGTLTSSHTYQQHPPHGHTPHGSGTHVAMQPGNACAQQQTNAQHPSHPAPSSQSMLMHPMQRQLHHQHHPQLAQPLPLSQQETFQQHSHRSARQQEGGGGGGGGGGLMRPHLQQQRVGNGGYPQLSNASLSHAADNSNNPSASSFNVRSHHDAMHPRQHANQPSQNTCAAGVGGGGGSSQYTATSPSNFYHQQQQPMPTPMNSGVQHDSRTDHASNNNRLPPPPSYGHEVPHHRGNSGTPAGLGMGMGGQANNQLQSVSSIGARGVAPVGFSNAGGAQQPPQYANAHPAGPNSHHGPQQQQRPLGANQHPPRQYY